MTRLYERATVNGVKFSNETVLLNREEQNIPINLKILSGDQNSNMPHAFTIENLITDQINGVKVNEFYSTVASATDKENYIHDNLDLDGNLFTDNLNIRSSINGVNLKGLMQKYANNIKLIDFQPRIKEIEEIYVKIVENVACELWNLKKKYKKILQCFHSYRSDNIF